MPLWPVRREESLLVTGTHPGTSIVADLVLVYFGALEAER